MCAYTSITSRYTYYPCACKTHGTKNAYNDGCLLRKQKQYYFSFNFRNAGVLVRGIHPARDTVDDENAETIQEIRS